MMKAWSLMGFFVYIRFSELDVKGKQSFFHGSLHMGAFLWKGKNSPDNVILLKLYFKDDTSKLLL